MYMYMYICIYIYIYTYIHIHVHINIYMLLRYISQIRRIQTSGFQSCFGGLCAFSINGKSLEYMAIWVIFIVRVWKAAEYSRIGGPNFNCYLFGSSDDPI